MNFFNKEAQSISSSTEWQLCLSARGKLPFRAGKSLQGHCRLICCCPLGSVCFLWVRLLSAAGEVHSFDFSQASLIKQLHRAKNCGELTGFHWPTAAEQRSYKAILAMKKATGVHLLFHKLNVLKALAGKLYKQFFWRMLILWVIPPVFFSLTRSKQIISLISVFRIWPTGLLISSNSLLLGIQPPNHPYAH